MNSDFKMPKDLAGYLEGMFAASRNRRAKAEAARPEIEAAERKLRDRAEDALRAGWVRHLGACGVPETLLETFRKGVRFTPVYKAAQQWLAQDDKPFLLLCGGYGSGKSIAAAAVLGEAKKTHSAYAHELSEEQTTWLEYDSREGLFLTAAQLHFARRYEDDNRPSLLDRAATVKWLVLDELRESDGKGAGRERLEEVLGERYAFQRRTVLTSNLDQAGVKALVGDRLASRFAEGLMTVDAGDTDMRRSR